MSDLAELLERVKAFCFGIAEFRSSVTLNFIDPDLMDAYDWGREWAHRITMRRFEQ